jgi:CubicO group peptidase (beta-lactamase class C family)
MYSNNAIELLGLALEGITGCSMEKMFTESIVKKLGLRRTSYSTPKSSKDGVIPGDATVSGWNANIGVLSP